LQRKKEDVCGAAFTQNLFFLVILSQTETVLEAIAPALLKERDLQRSEAIGKRWGRMVRTLQEERTEEVKSV